MSAMSERQKAQNHMTRAFAHKQPGDEYTQEELQAIAMYQAIIFVGVAIEELRDEVKRKK